MSLIFSSYSDEDVIRKAQVDADYLTNEIKSDYARFMMEYGTGKVVLTHSVVDTFRKKWIKSLSRIEDIIFALELDPRKVHLKPRVEDILKQLNDLITENIFFMDKYLVPEGDIPVQETPEEVKARAREERRKRMKEFTGE